MLPTILYVASIPGLAVLLGIVAIVKFDCIRRYVCTAIVYAAAQRLAVEIDANVSQTLRETLSGDSEEDPEDDQDAPPEVAQRQRAKALNRSNMKRTVAA